MLRVRFVYEYNVFHNFGLGLEGKYRKTRDTNGPVVYNRWDEINYRFGIYASYYTHGFGKGFFGSIGFEYVEHQAKATGTLIGGAPIEVTDSESQSGVGIMAGYSWKTKV